MQGKVRTYLWALVALVGVGAFTRLLTWAMDTQSYNTWGALIWVPIIALGNLLLIDMVFRNEPDRWISRLVLVGYLAKLVGIAGRYVVVFVVYGGVGDANRYNLFAAFYYFLWRKGDFDTGPEGQAGTHNVELITTALYTIIGPSAIVGFFVFGSLAFWGSILLLKAFREAVPDGDHRRYTVLLLLLPSFLYWPSSIGKEALLMFAIGLVALGVARLFNNRPASGVVYGIAGLALAALIRPHLTLLLVAAIFVAQILRPTGGKASGFVAKLAGVVIVGIAASIILTQAADFLGVDLLNLQEVAEKAETVGGNTDQGGSAFEPVPLDSPLGIPAAIVTLLFRPFVWEAKNAQMLVQALEASGMLVLAIVSWRRLASLPRLLRRNPYIVFAVTYTFAFILAFASFSNFGILARQRVLMLPFFLALLALPDPRKATSGDELEEENEEYASVSY